MLCNKCRKARATIHSIEISIEGGIKDYHMCGDCAKSMGLAPQFDENKLEDAIQRLLNEAISEQEESPDPKKPVQKIRNKTCPECDTTLARAISTGKFGCENDYKVFRDELKHFFKRMSGAWQHKGKVPTLNTEAGRKQQTIRALEKQLDDAVRAEDYELAAKLRDRLRELK